LTALQYAVLHGCDTSTYETRARECFSKLIEKEALLDLPLGILRRIVDVSLQETQFDKLFQFLVKCPDKFGSVASVLFRGVHMKHFSISQLDQLRERKDLNWVYVSDSVCDTISLCVNEMEKHRKQFEEEHAVLGELQAECQSVLSDYRRQVGIIAALSTRLEALEGGLQTTDSELRALKADCTKKSDVVRLETDLQANYAKKFELTKLESDLRTNYAKKSDLTRLESDLRTNCAKKSDVQKVEQDLSCRSPFQGIIAHLTSQFGGNVHEKGVVDIKSDRPYSSSPDHAPKNIADLEIHSNFDCADAENMWVCYDFKNRRVRLTYYLLRSYDCRFLRSWVIEVSDDGSHWTEVDRRENNTDLNGKYRVAIFPVCKLSVCRYVRLRQIGKNHDKNDYDTRIEAFELFGALIT